MADQKTYVQALPVGFQLTGGINDYTIEKVLGQGGFGITYKVKTRIKTGNITVTTHFAVKEFFPSGCWRTSGSTEMLYAPTSRQEIQACLKDFITEGQRLQRMCQLNNSIVNVNEVFEANGTAYFVMEYLSGGDLRNLVKKNGKGLSEAQMLSIMNPIAEAVQCLHNNNMLHLDIKPENIVMRQSDDGSPDVPVLIDFGIAVHFKKDGSPTTTHPAKGVTPGYSPAEQFAGVNRFDPRIDIYALSATCYYMITAKDPHNAFEITDSDIAKELSPLVSDRTRDAIVRGMAHSAQNRPDSIASFLKGFKKTNALPMGTIIYGLNTSYMIMSVVDETPDYVQYKASTVNEDQKNDQNVKSIARIQYNIWEQIDNGKRIPFATGGEVPQTRPWMMVPLLNKSGFEPQGYGSQTSETGTVDSEYFNAAGVEYLTVREGYNPARRSRLFLFDKPERPKKVEEKEDTKTEKPMRTIDPEAPKKGGGSKKTLIIVLAALGVALLAGLIVWFLMNQKPSNEVSTSDSSPSTSISAETSVSVDEASAEEPSIASFASDAASDATKEPTKEIKDLDKEKKDKAKDKDKDKYKDKDKGKDKDKDKKDIVTSPDDAFNKGDLDALKKMARNGNSRAQWLLNNNGIPY